MAWVQNLRANMWGAHIVAESDSESQHAPSGFRSRSCKQITVVVPMLVIVLVVAISTVFAKAAQSNVVTEVDTSAVTGLEATAGVGRGKINAMYVIPTDQPLPANTAESVPSKAVAASNSSIDSSRTKSSPTDEVLCHTATKGERCYQSVLWAYFTGIHTHPEWYKELTLQSKFEDFQAKFHREKIGNCSRPCDTATELLAQKPWGKPSLLCFSVVSVSEIGLVKVQVSNRAGIFDCDEKVAFSDKPLDLGMGIETSVIDMVDGGMAEHGTAANVQTFINAWNLIIAAGHFKHHEFTAKVDPDCVMLPDRLRFHLASNVGSNVYIPNCDHRDIWPGSPDYPMMYGALEVLSRLGVETYSKGQSRCQNELPWQNWGEDMYLGHCLSLLAVGKAFDGSQVLDETCCPGSPGTCPDRKNCADGSAAAFHKFKSPGEWLYCWRQATVQYKK